LFGARFGDGIQGGLWAHPDLGDRKIARSYDGKVAKALAYFPSKRRETLSHLGLHHGGLTTFTEPKSQFFMLYHPSI
jgi:hypothetical protein